MLNKLQQLLSENNNSLMNANYKQVIESIMSDEKISTQEHRTEILKS